MAALLSVAELASLLGRSERFVYRLVHERRITHIKLGDRPKSPVAFEAEVVEAFIAAHRVDARAS